MSEKAEAAQKWAEAKSALDAARETFHAADEALTAAAEAEKAAWSTLEEMAERKPIQAAPPDPMKVAFWPNNRPLATPYQQQVMVHGDLPIKPLG